jgi:hypothetical protein
VLTEYHDPDDGLFRRLVLPVLERYSGRQLGRLVATDRRTIDRIRHGQHPRDRLSQELLTTAVAVARQDLAAAESLPAGWNSETGRFDQGLILLTAWNHHNKTRQTLQAKAKTTSKGK